MKRRVEDWKIAKLLRETPRISFPEYQREKSLWSPEKKALLIDTILENIDIPKLYFNRTSDGGYEVVDGQQRLWAIWEFFADDYSYKTNKFSELSKSQQDALMDYELQITVFEDADDSYLRKLFVRLQIALLLVSGEKLHALSGAMKDLVFTKLVSHKFVKALGIPVRRFAKQTLCAQICINVFMKAKNGTFATTRFENLQHFFQEYAQPKARDKQFFEAMAKRITFVMNELWESFGEKSSQLTNRSYILSVCLFFDELLGERDEIPKGEAKQFVEFTLLLWKRLKEEARKGFDRTNKELYTFGTYVSSAPTEKYQIDNRHRELWEHYEHFKKTGRIKGD
jgi:hypothetical protein